MEHQYEFFKGISHSIIKLEFSIILYLLQFMCIEINSNQKK